MNEQHSAIVAIVTTNPKNLTGGGTPVFIVTNGEVLQKTSLTLEKIMDASAHEINSETIIIVAR